jgi:hypothetical protein
VTAAVFEQYVADEFEVPEFDENRHPNDNSHPLCDQIEQQRYGRALSEQERGAIGDAIENMGDRLITEEAAKRAGVQLSDDGGSGETLGATQRSWERMAQRAKDLDRSAPEPEELQYDLVSPDPFKQSAAWAELLKDRLEGKIDPLDEYDREQIREAEREYAGQSVDTPPDYSRHE